MPTPPIGEIVQKLLSNDQILDALEQRRWYVEIETVKEEEFSVLRNPDRSLKIRQWDFPKVFMQSVTYAGQLVYQNRGVPGNGLFEHPEIYVAGRWEEEVRKLYQLFCR